MPTIPEAPFGGSQKGEHISFRGTARELNGGTMNWRVVATRFLLYDDPYHNGVQDTELFDKAHSHIRQYY